MESDFVTKPLMFNEGFENFTIVPVPKESIFPAITVKILICMFL